MTPDRGWFRRRLFRDDLKSEVTDEIGFHLEALVAEYVSAGMPEPDARRKATERFGDPERIAGAMRTLAHQRERVNRRTAVLRGIDRDVRFAFRQARKRPAFTCIALVTLALGIGANTAIFSAVNQVLLHPIAAEHLDRIAFVQDNFPRLGLNGTPLDPAETHGLFALRTVFRSVGGLASGSATLTRESDTQRLVRGRTIGSFFEVFGVHAHIGRLYRPDESQAGNHRVAVLSYDYWRELGSDSAIVGRTMMLNDSAFTVIGVMQRDFRFPRGAHLWSPLPYAPDTLQNRGRLSMITVGRFDNDVDPGQVDAALSSYGLLQHPGSTRADFFMSTRPFVSAMAGELQPALIVLLVAVAFVLLIACANVASLQLVHGAGRMREMAVRAALGAGRVTLVRQLVVENVVLATVGGVLGVGVGVASLRLLAGMGASQLAALQHLHVDLRALGFTAATTLVTAVAVGLVPAWRGGDVDMNVALKSGTRQSGDRSHHRLISGAVVMQLALAIVLVLGAALMIQSFRRLLAQHPGFDDRGVYTMRLAVAGPRARPPQITVFYDELVGRLRRASGVSSVGLISELPFSGATNSSPFRIIGREADPSAPALHANLRVTGGDYFAAMGIPLIRGRLFSASDRKGSEPVAIIDETLANTYFPNEDPIGKRINQGPDATIVGIVGTVSHDELGEPAKSTFYYPYSQKDWYASLYIAVRSSLPLASVQQIVRAEVQSIDPGVPLFEVRSLHDRIGASVAPRKLAMSVLTALAMLSLGLAMFGMYGVISYAVAERRQEFGIRVALGARAADVSTMVLRQAALLGVTGVTIGIVASYFATQALSRLVFGVSPRDPVSFAIAAAAMTGVALVAAYVPARRATRIDPVDALRQ
jgi:predicted permease